jgi:hypothetical protein
MFAAQFNFNSDYINANYISDMYIATQGPVPDAFSSFWQMVWEQKSNVVVMITNEVHRCVCLSLCVSLTFFCLSLSLSLCFLSRLLHSSLSPLFSNVTL